MPLTMQDIQRRVEAQFTWIHTPVILKLDHLSIFMGYGETGGHIERNGRAAYQIVTGL